MFKEAESQAMLKDAEALGRLALGPPDNDLMAWASPAPRTEGKENRDPRLKRFLAPHGAVAGPGHVPLQLRKPVDELCTVMREELRAAKALHRDNSFESVKNYDPADERWHAENIPVNHVVAKNFFTDLRKLPEDIKPQEEVKSRLATVNLLETSMAFDSPSGEQHVACPRQPPLLLPSLLCLIYIAGLVYSRTYTSQGLYVAGLIHSRSCI